MIYGVKVYKGKIIATIYDKRTSVPVDESVVEPEDVLDFIEELASKQK